MSSTFNAKSLLHGKHIWPSEWNSVSMPGTDADAIGLIKESTKRFATMTDAIRHEFKKGNRRRASRALRTALVSDSAKIASFAHAVSARLRPGPTPGIGLTIVQDSLSLDMWASPKEPVFWDVYEKVVGKQTINYSFGLLETARQFLCKRVVEAVAELSPRQFILQGSMVALVAWMNAHVPNAKVVWTTDIPNCFFVLNRGCVEAGMPLPGRVTRSVLFDAMDRANKRAPAGGEGNTYPLTPSDYGCGAGAWGIPRGSALASLAAELCLRPILDAVEGSAEGVMMAIYGDNIIILAPSKKAADVSIAALRNAALERISESAVNGLCTRIVRSTPAQGFAFVQSNFKLTKGVLRRRLSSEAIDAFETKILHGLHHNEFSRASARRKIDGWIAQSSFDPRATKLAVKLIADHKLVEAA